MGYVRLAHPDDFDHTAMEFNDFCFKKSTGGGMSLFELECGQRVSGDIQKHVEAYYNDLTGNPAIFCIIEDAEMPPHSVLKIVDTEPDECHRDLDAAPGQTLGNKGIKKHFRRKRHWKNFYITEGESYRPLTLQDIEGWRQQRFS